MKNLTLHWHYLILFTNMTWIFLEEDNESLPSPRTDDEMMERVHKTEREKRLLPFISISENSKTISKLNSEGLRSCGLPLRLFPEIPQLANLLLHNLIPDI